MSKEVPCVYHRLVTYRRWNLKFHIVLIYLDGCDTYWKVYKHQRRWSRELTSLKIMQAPYNKCRWSSSGLLSFHKYKLLADSSKHRTIIGAWIELRSTECTSIWHMLVEDGIYCPANSSQVLSMTTRSLEHPVEVISCQGALVSIIYILYFPPQGSPRPQLVEHWCTWWAPSVRSSISRHWDCQIGQDHR